MGFDDPVSDGVVGRTDSVLTLEPRAVKIIDALYDDGRGMLSRDAAKLLLTRAIRDEREACARIADANVEPSSAVVDTGRIWRNGMALFIASEIRHRAASPETVSVDAPRAAPRDAETHRERAQNVTTAWLMSRFGGGLGAVPTSAFQELERLIGLALATLEAETRDEMAALRAENLRLAALSERLRLEAEVHAQEARTQRATVHEIYQLVTGATGEPGDWHGAEPVREALASLRAVVGAVKEAAAVFHEVSEGSRLKDMDEWRRLARKYKSEGDAYGYNFYEGMASGANSVDLDYQRAARILKAALDMLERSRLGDAKNEKTAAPEARGEA